MDIHSIQIMAPSKDAIVDHLRKRALQARMNLVKWEQNTEEPPTDHDRKVWESFIREFRMEAEVFSRTADFYESHAPETIIAH